LGVAAFQIGQNLSAIELINCSLAGYFDNASTLGNLEDVYREINGYG
jgi:hypothetical protein